MQRACYIASSILLVLIGSAQSQMSGQWMLRVVTESHDAFEFSNLEQQTESR